MPHSSFFNEFELSFLKEAAKLVDSRLDLLELEAKESNDPDSRGIFDKAEHMVGFGLVACQTYITACISQSELTKKQALARGPQHLSGYSMVCVVNALANYWKHNSEWGEHISKQAQETIEVISSLKVNIHSSYVATTALSTLLQPNEPCIARLIPFLKQWHSSLYPT
jgi:hypothetical protein